MVPLQTPLLVIDGTLLTEFWKSTMNEGVQARTLSSLIKESSLFESLSNINEWLKRRGQDKNLTAVNTALQIIKTNPGWLIGVIEEINHVVPVGAISRPVWELCQAIIQCLAQQEKSQADKQVNDLMIRMLKEEDCTNLKVTSILYTLAMRAAPKYAESLFKILVARHKRDPSRCTPSVSNKVSLIVAIAKTGRANDASRLLWNDAPVSLYNIVLVCFKSPDEADKLLLQMESNLYRKKGTKPNLRSFGIVLRKWTAIDATKAQGVLERVLAWSKSLPDLRPTVDFFIDVMKAHGAAAEPVEFLMIRLVNYINDLPISERSKPGYSTSMVPYEICMNAWMKKGHPERVERVLSDMITKSIRPTKLCWMLAAKTWTASGDVERADRIVRQAGFSADVDLCNIVLQGWGQRDAQQAERYFDWMCHRSRQMRPDATSYKIMLTSWKKSSSYLAASRVQLLLDRMEKDAREGLVHPTPDTYELAKKIIKNTVKKRIWKNAPEHIEARDERSVLQKTDTTNRDSGTIYQGSRVLEPTGWRFREEKPHTSRPWITSEEIRLTISTCRGSDVAEDIFNRMETDDVSPTSVSLDCVIGALSSTMGHDTLGRRRALLKRLERRTDPDADSCNSVLAICLSNPCRRASETSRSMVTHMMREYKKGKIDMKPRASYFKLLFLNLYRERSRIPSIAALALVEGIQFPDQEFEISCFIYALTVCAWSRDDEAPKHALRLWQQLTYTSLECFNLVLKAFANHPKHVMSEMAQTLLTVAIGSRDSNWKPDAESYNLVIEAVAKSRRRDAAQQACSLLQRYQSRIKGTESLSHVLVACAMISSVDSGTKLHHFHLATRTMQHWKDQGGVTNSLHYLRLLTCAIRLGPTAKDRVSMGKKVFQDCCADGLVDLLVLRRFWTLAPPMVRSDLLGHYVKSPTLRDLPKKWTSRASHSPRRKI